MKFIVTTLHEVEAETADQARIKALDIHWRHYGQKNTDDFARQTRLTINPKG